MDSIGSRDPKMLREVAIDTQIDSTWDKVLQFTSPEADGFTKKSVASKILKHYWMREIGLETVALWKHKITTRLEEIMPKYVKMYTDIISSGSLMENINTVEKGKLTKDGSQHDSGEASGQMDNHTNNISNRNNHSVNQFSDTPQDGLSDVIDGRYLTNASVDNSEDNLTNNQTVNQTTSGASTLERTTHDHHDNLVSRNGFEGDKINSVWQYSKKVIDIYQLIIRDVADCFMGILG